MEKERIHLRDDLYIETYPFSDYITCVEVYVNGESFSAFCSDNSIVEEWTENPELLIELCDKHMQAQPKKVKDVTSHHNRKPLPDGIEIELYSFSDDVYCVNVFKENKMITSFCSDRASMEEWEEDPVSLQSIIKTLVK